MIEARLRDGYTALVNARTLPPNDKAWLPLIRDVQLPAWMLPAVQRAVRKGSWRNAKDPLSCVRKSAEREAKRMGLSEKPAPPKGE